MDDDKKPPVQQNTLDAVLTEIRATRADVQCVANDVTLIKDRVRMIEKRVDDIEDKGSRFSGGVRQLSETDAKHEAAIANLTTEIAETKALVVAGNADTSAIKDAIDDFVKKNPKAIGGLLWGLVGVIGAALAAAAAWFRAKAGHQ